MIPKKYIIHKLIHCCRQSILYGIALCVSLSAFAENLTKTISLHNIIDSIQYRFSSIENDTNRVKYRKSLDTIEVFGSRYKEPEKMDFLTRMPFKPSEQLQSISVISHKMIAQQGNLTLGEATRNVVGVTTFSTYGGASESLTARGFRGLPILKNGVRVNSNFRGQGILTDVQGIESIQILKGSAAVTQGIGNDLGSAGGTVNIATKIPKFINQAIVGLRIGSWWDVRPTFDLQTVVNKKETFGFRLNGAYESSDNYRKYVTKQRIYLNPSMAWKINSKATLIVEMDYLHDTRTPDRGTINLAADSINALYHMPHHKFLGFTTDKIFTTQISYIGRFNYQIDPHLSLRIALAVAGLAVDNTGASTAKFKNSTSYNIIQRSLGRSLRKDNNQTLQIDLVGQNYKTGIFTHMFQTGLDFRSTQVSTNSYLSKVIDTINVLENFINTLPQNISLQEGSLLSSSSYSYGIMAQYILSISKYAKVVMGGRYSLGNSIDNTSSGAVSGEAFNPIIGIIITPIKELHIFGSYTTTTDLRSANNLKMDGSPIGASTIQQFETGIKTELIDGRLRANLTLFHVLNTNLAYQVYDEADQATGRYDQAGDLKRKGIEIEVIGNVINGLDVVLGYALLDARYQNSPAFVDGSTPMNAPKHTANAWIYYHFQETVMKGLSIGIGAYYIGSRPITDYTKVTIHSNTNPGIKPFLMNPYTTLNATVGYTYKKLSFQLWFNNITNALGYSSYYRGGYINPIDPFNFAASVAYKF
ncbi:MAG: TonB-dependent siderophore receptor [Chitinophagaceae bacterium]